MKKKIISLIFFILLISILIEFSLRLFLGLGNPPLFVADEDIGYLYKANQSLVRFGNEIFYNEFHQRSDPLMKNYGYRILIVGDSITNGGVLINQNKTISELLEKKLNKKCNCTGEVLSASAKSWGIENEWEYIKKFGIFNSGFVILQIGTHDLLQAKSTSDSLGTHRHPLTKPFAAIYELLQYKNLEIFENNINEQSKDIDYSLQFQKNLNATQNIINFVKERNSTLIVLLTPNRDELDKETDLKEKEKFIELLNKNNITFINLLDKEFGLKKEHFRDGVHLNERGNGFVGNVLFEHIKDG